MSDKFDFNKYLILKGYPESRSMYQPRNGPRFFTVNEVPIMVSGYSFMCKKEWYSCPTSEADADQLIKSKFNTDGK